MEFEKSRIYTFFDQSKRFCLNFFDGQKYINDVVRIQKMPNQSLNFLNDSLLSYPTLLAFTKPGEDFGLYIDSSSPYFLFKFESFGLKSRTLLLPDTLESYPEKIKGVCRLQKYSPNTTPYTSLLEIIDESPSEVFNKILNQSYQVDATLYLSPFKSQSVMIYKVPEQGGVGLSSHESIANKFDPDKKESLQYLDYSKDTLNKIFSKKHNSLLNIVRDFEKHGFEYLVSRVIEFSCRCSFDYYLDKVTAFGVDEIRKLFSEQKCLSIKCDYCKKEYSITKDHFPNLIDH